MPNFKKTFVPQLTKNIHRTDKAAKKPNKSFSYR